MFDIGFWEIAVIAVVALLVVGPEEFPALVRTIGSWLGKIRGFMNDARTELEKEAGKAEELKRLIEQEARIAELHRIAEQANARIPIDGETRKKLNDIGAARPQEGQDGQLTPSTSTADESSHGETKKEVSP
ncbi:MAG TPA: twin-arginine translocase subunit TatB [Chromatiales bacterium]|nr:twin-arginine translocase subunit TatB [Chromatiales bacterium]